MNEEKKKKPRKPVDIRKATNRALTDVKIFKAMTGTIHERFATAMHYGMSLITDEWNACFKLLNELIARWPEQSEETEENRARLLTWLIEESRKDDFVEQLT
jgi:hypothetical protein